ncbi:hypothetical protein FJTKL_08303 [Diaporthe vaccinii]|uniref:Uncharacterized protein n=1 Tax=Diaporthe vaccinii TaxID=105482 RepID=A0ABR4ESU6_9PEZI
MQHKGINMQEPRLIGDSGRHPTFFGRPCDLGRGRSWSLLLRSVGWGEQAGQGSLALRSPPARTPDHLHKGQAMHNDPKLGL